VGEFEATGTVKVAIVDGGFVAGDAGGADGVGGGCCGSVGEVGGDIGRCHIGRLSAVRGGKL